MKKNIRLKKIIMTKKLTFIDLCCGIGGFHIGLSNNWMKCVLSADIDEECRKTYFENYNLQPLWDIKDIDEKTVPNHDVLCAGFPCQPFSISWKQKGFEDERWVIFFEIARIIKEKQPKVVFLENVKQLKYHDKGKTLQHIIETLQDLWYKVSWDILNGKDFWTAQNRERIIIIWHKEKAFDFEKLKQEAFTPKNIKDILLDNREHTYLEENEYTLIDNPKRQKSGLIFAWYRNKGMRTKGVRPNTEHLSRVHKQPNRIYSSDGTHPTIPSQETSWRFFILHNGKVRKLHIDECFNLMWFPKDFKKISSNGKLYNQIWNSVCVPMIDAIWKQLIQQYF